MLIQTGAYPPYDLNRCSKEVKIYCKNFLYSYILDVAKNRLTNCIYKDECIKLFEKTIKTFSFDKNKSLTLKQPTGPFSSIGEEEKNKIVFKKVKKILESFSIMKSWKLTIEE
ncbi:MAG: hypothetical protein Q8K60_06275 [Parachlamydiaceae bacterium]|nr:hypothetical protein [Parachlamydiaceae bacterium]